MCEYMCICVQCWSEVILRKLRKDIEYVVECTALDHRGQMSEMYIFI